jgi:hypothetical protein
MACRSRNRPQYHHFKGHRGFLWCCLLISHNLASITSFFTRSFLVLLEPFFTMGFFKVVVTFIWELTSLAPTSLNPFSSGSGHEQHPIFPPHDSSSAEPWRPGTASLTFPVDGISSTSMCEYDLDPAVWEPCNTPENRLCWLQNKQTGQNYTINTDCEALPYYNQQYSYSHL